MTPGETLTFALTAETDECIIWPHCVDSGGYALIRRGGKTRRVTRMVLGQRVGPAPRGHLALHGPCHNRRCINPRHLRWGTHLENQDDTLRDGTRGKKLDAETVRAIRARVGENQYQVAVRFGVSQGTVSRIQTGVMWGALS